jgi:hypothetical protein
VHRGFSYGTHSFDSRHHRNRSRANPLLCLVAASRINGHSTLQHSSPRYCSQGVRFHYFECNLPSYCMRQCRGHLPNNDRITNTSIIHLPHSTSNGSQWHSRSDMLSFLDSENRSGCIPPARRQGCGFARSVSSALSPWYARSLYARCTSHYFPRNMHPSCLKHEGRRR